MDCIRKNYEENEKECKELNKTISRLSRTCNKQEKTIDGLWERLSEQFDKQFERLKMEDGTNEINKNRTGFEEGVRIL